MKKFLFSFLMLIAAVPLWAHDFEVDGIYYNITDETALTVEVTFSDATSDMVADEYIGSVTIPETVIYNSKTYSVTSIGSSAFSSCTGLTSVTIPNSVTSIGDYAFSRCTGLTSVTIPNSVTSIGREVFTNCTGLTEITIPNSVTSIGSSAFYKTPWLENQPDGVMYINNLLYKYIGTMPAGTSIDIKDGTTTICHSAFWSCTGLTSVTIPNSVTSIGDYAFNNCDDLTSVTIPNSITSIGSGVFTNCDGLTEITIPNSVTSIGSRAFWDCTGLTEITIPNSVTSIESDAFDGTPWYNNQPNGVMYINNILYSYIGTMPAGTSITHLGKILSC